MLIMYLCSQAVLVFSSTSPSESDSLSAVEVGEEGDLLLSKENPSKVLHSPKLYVLEVRLQFVNSSAKLEMSLSDLMMGMKGTFIFLLSRFYQLIIPNQGCCFIVGMCFILS